MATVHEEPDRAKCQEAAENAEEAEEEWDTRGAAQKPRLDHVVDHADDQDAHPSSTRPATNRPCRRSQAAAGT